MSLKQLKSSRPPAQPARLAKARLAKAQAIVATMPGALPSANDFVAERRAAFTHEK